MNSSSITWYRNGDTVPQELPLPPARPGAYLESFLAELRGEAESLHLSSRESLAAARLALQLQAAADQQQHNVPLGG